MIMRAKFGWWLQRIAIKMPLIVVILIFMSGKTSIFGLSEYEKSLFFYIIYLRAFKISCYAEFCMKKVL